MISYKRTHLWVSGVIPPVVSGVRSFISPLWKRTPYHWFIETITDENETVSTREFSAHQLTQNEH